MSNKSKKEEKFWLENPYILFKNICNFNPFVSFTNKNLSKNMNIYTRLVIIVTIVLFCITKKIDYVFIGIFLVIIIIILYYSFRKDSFETIPSNFPFFKSNNLDVDDRLNEKLLPRRKSDYNNTTIKENNPAKNISIPEYNNKPEFSKSTPSDSDMSDYINGKIFQTADQWIFDKNTNPFYTTANTSIPNDQTAFANWLYGTESNCKSGSIYAHRTGTPNESLNCNGFNVSVPTNFGNLNDYIPSDNN